MSILGTCSDQVEVPWYVRLALWRKHAARAAGRREVEYLWSERSWRWLYTPPDWKNAAISRAINLMMCVGAVMFIVGFVLPIFVLAWPFMCFDYWIRQND